MPNMPSSRWPFCQKTIFIGLTLRSGRSLRICEIGSGSELPKKRKLEGLRKFQTQPGAYRPSTLVFLLHTLVLINHQSSLWRPFHLEIPSTFVFDLQSFHFQCRLFQLLRDRPLWVWLAWVHRAHKFWNVFYNLSTK